MASSAPLNDETVTSNPMKAAPQPAASTGIGGAAAKSAAMTMLARFSTAATQMTGEGLVEYGIFMDPKSMTKIPEAKGFWGKCQQFLCTHVQGRGEEGKSEAPTLPPPPPSSNATILYPLTRRNHQSPTKYSETRTAASAATRTTGSST